MEVNLTPGCWSLQQRYANQPEVMWEEPGLLCWRGDMHSNNSDKLDLTANHRQQWPRTLRAAVCPTLQRGSASTAAHQCGTLPKRSHLGQGLKSL